MNKGFYFRLGAVVLLLWLSGALAAWLFLGPRDALVGVRASHAAALPDYRLAAEDLAAAVETLKNKPIWGMERNGQPQKTAAAKKAEEEKARTPPPWLLLAAVNKPGERYIIVSINKQPPSVIKEGETLPDGALLHEVGDKTLLVEDAAGVKKQIYLSF